MTLSNIRRHLRLVILLSVVVAIAISYYFIIPIYRLSTIENHYSQAVKFESSSWKEAASKRDSGNVRARMVDDLVKSHQLIGKSRSDLISLLGEPNNPAPFKSAGWNMVYWLGQENSLFPIDSVWLVFRIDDDGKVVAFDKITD